MNLIERMQINDKLADKEKWIVDYLINNKDHVQKLSLRKLAIKSNVSAPTVLRMMNKLGYSNYVDFKIDLLKIIDNELNNGDFTIDQNDDILTVIKKAATLQQDIINATNAKVSFEEIYEVSIVLFKSKIIDLYGSGLNYHINETFTYNLLRLGKKAFAFDSTEEKYYRATMSNKNHTAIILSHTGNRDNTIKLVKMLKKRKTYVIAITSRLDSTLANIADEAIYIDAGDGFDNFSTMIFRISVQHLYNVLTGALYARYCEEIKESFIEFDELSKY